MIALIVIGSIFLILFLVFLIHNWAIFRQVGQTTKWKDVGKVGRATAKGIKK